MGYKKRLIGKSGEEIFYCNDLFPTVANIIELIKDKEECIVPERQVRGFAAAETDGLYSFPE